MEILAIDSHNLVKKKAASKNGDIFNEQALPYDICQDRK
jgi:hypothetical protein